MSAEPALINFDEIDEAGTYVETRWGSLFRMPANILPRRRHQHAKRLGSERWPVIKVSSDPFISLAVAYRLAVAMGILLKF